MKFKSALTVVLFLAAGRCFARPALSHDVHLTAFPLSICIQTGRDALVNNGYTLGNSGDTFVYAASGIYQAGVFCEAAPNGGSLFSVFVTVVDGKQGTPSKQVDKIMSAVTSPQPAPYYPQPNQPVYPQPNQPGYQPNYPQPNQPNYPQPNQPVYPQPNQPVYPQPNQPNYPQPYQPNYQPNYPQPSQPTYPPQPYAGPVNWVSVSGSQPIPTDVAIAGGTEADGRRQYVCRTRHNGALLPGKAVTSFGTNCIVAYQGSEWRGDEFEILTGDPNDYIWAAPDPMRPPFYTGNESGVNLSTCRAHLTVKGEDAGTHIGKLLGSKCTLSYKFNTYTPTTFQVLYHR